MAAVFMLGLVVVAVNNNGSNSSFSLWEEKKQVFVTYYRGIFFLL